MPIELYIKCPVSWITSDRYYTIDSNNESDDMWDEYFDSNAMNVHIVNDAPAAGRARTPGKCLYISNNSANTLTHEFGHNFGLQHTHNGRWPCDGDNETCADCWQEPIGHFTVADVLTATNQEEHEKKVREWTENVWNSWYSRHTQTIKTIVNDNL